MESLTWTTLRTRAKFGTMPWESRLFSSALDRGQVPGLC
jgi:hypothetical protein